jgi:hypothetical protein
VPSCEQSRHPARTPLEPCATPSGLVGSMSSRAAPCRRGRYQIGGSAALRGVFPARTALMPTRCSNIVQPVDAGGVGAPAALSSARAGGTITHATARHVTPATIRPPQCDAGLRRRVQEQGPSAAPTATRPDAGGELRPPAAQDSGAAPPRRSSAGLRRVGRVAVGRGVDRGSGCVLVDGARLLGSPAGLRRPAGRRTLARFGARLELI